jgi:hypothetical protein
LIRFLRGSITNQGLHFAAQKPDHKSSPISLVSTFFDYFSIFYTFITKAIRKYINYLNLIAEWHINGAPAAAGREWSGNSLLLAYSLSNFDFVCFFIFSLPGQAAGLLCLENILT